MNLSDYIAIYCIIVSEGIMKKRHIFIGILVVMLSIPFIYGSFSNLAYTAEGANTVSYSTAISNGKPSVILFYANWCTYCRKFMPIFNSLSKTNSGNYNFVKVNIDSSSNAALSREYGINSVPSVYIAEPKYKVKKEVSSYSYGSVNTMQAELDYYLQHRR